MRTCERWTPGWYFRAPTGQMLCDDCYECFHANRECILRYFELKAAKSEEMV